MSRGRPGDAPPEHPALIVPPYTISDGRFTRAMPITTPGMFLSHPATVTAPSYHCAERTVSTLSAINSRDGRE